MNIKYLEDGKIKMEGNYKGQKVNLEFQTEIEFKNFIKAL